MKLQEYPKQSFNVGKTVQVLFENKPDIPENIHIGVIIRDDAYCTIIKLLNNNKFVLSHEVYYNFRN